MTEFVIAKRIAGPDPSTARNKAYINYEVTYDVAVLGGAGTYPLVTVAAGDVVLSVANLVTTTMAGGQDPGGVIGDDGSTNRFITKFTSGSATATAVPYAYAAANTIDLVVAADTATGAGRVFVTVFRP